MSVMTKLLPIAAIGVVGAMNSDAIKNNLDIISRAKVAATSGIEMRNVADAVAIQFTESQRLPFLNFGRFLVENTVEKGGAETRDRSKDMWGAPYRIYMNYQKKGFEIRSAGPDVIWGSTDDLQYLYVLPGSDVQAALAKQAAEWQRLVAYYKQLDAENGANADATDPQMDAKNSGSQNASKTNDAELKRFQSQMQRAEAGSASAKLSLAERFIQGDEIVEKDPAKAEQLLEEALEGIDSQILKTKAENLLRLIRASKDR
ncbi:MAG: hypothetical protein ISQ14_04415 [Verrucomicrobiae bacterium]|jgi:hypothetical protein|nr:hypothetical protein [Verrucomicrobiae bacterium]